jgi:hypothetical protein
MIEDGIEYESIGEIFGLVLHETDAETLRELLDHTIAEGIIRREDLEEAYEELSLVGISQAASLVREAADQFESKVTPEVVKTLRSRRVQIARLADPEGKDPLWSEFLMLGAGSNESRPLRPPRPPCHRSGKQGWEIGVRSRQW